MTLDEIREALAGRKLVDIARAAGLHRATVERIASGANKNPTLATMRAIEGAINGNGK